MSSRLSPTSGPSSPAALLRALPLMCGAAERATLSAGPASRAGGGCLGPQRRGRYSPTRSLGRPAALSLGLACRTHSLCTAVQLIIDVLALFMNGKIYEPLWGSIEFLKFIGIVNFFSCLATTCTFLFIYTVTFSLDVLFSQFDGMVAVLIAFTVAMKQAFPQRTMRVGAITLESRLLPISVVVLLLVLMSLRVIPVAHALLGVYGWLFSWLYLRFYQHHDNMRGDASEAMAFVDFFPAPLQPVIGIISNQIFRLVVLLHICPKEPQQYDLGGPSTIKIALPGVRQADANRRRDRALRDLESRLKTTTPLDSVAVSDGTSAQPAAADNAAAGGGLASSSSQAASGGASPNRPRRDEA
eukprot:m.103638 g.103638  ORF g.103638 m.103638 type:complete len:357 (-) comp9071_c0_seq1:106-1176(-)